LRGALPPVLLRAVCLVRAILLLVLDSGMRCERSLSERLLGLLALFLAGWGVQLRHAAKGRDYGRGSKSSASRSRAVLAVRVAGGRNWSGDGPVELPGPQRSIQTKSFSK
jgi:hypothetical protein